jgi:hypothetical protein
MHDRDTPQHQPDVAGANIDLAAVASVRGPTWDEARGEREVSVPLAYLPTDVELADDFPEPIRYDAEKLVLAYRGVMTRASRQRLRGMSKDLPFQLAVDRLFAVAAADRAAQGRWFTCGGLSLAVLVLLGISLAALSWPGAHEQVEEVLDLDGPPPAVVDVEPADVSEAVEAADSPNDETGEPLLVDEQPASS